MKTLIIFCILFMFTLSQSEQQKFNFEFTIKCNLTLDKANELEKELLDLVKEYGGSLSTNITATAPQEYNKWNYDFRLLDTAIHKWSY